MSHRGSSRGRATSAGTVARALVGGQLDVLALGHGSAVGGVDVAAAVLAGLTGEEVRLALVLELARVHGESRGSSGTLVALELGGVGWYSSQHCSPYELIQGLLTGNDTAAALVVGDGSLGVDTELRSRQAVVANAHLAIAQLAKVAGGTTGGGHVEAAAIAAANESVGSGSEGREGNKVLHVG